ncbi:MAG: hypothetical protein LBR88_10085 [Zoogloeaceae bacterium]|jgi:hypothetical protein|nr:hypothetical protein [Zoogloeaceae bacterium]
MCSRCVVSGLLLSGTILLTSGSVAAQTVRLVCGGENQNSFTRMMAEEKAHTLLILYVSKDARYLSGVETQIINAGKPLMEEKKCGPLGHLDVAAAGTYELKARYQGVEQRRTLELAPQSSSRVMFMWD